MGWTSTLIGMGLCLAVGLVARVQSARPPDPTRVRLIPWTTILIGCVVLGLLLMVHAVNLAGYKTGRSPV